MFDRTHLVRVVVLSAVVAFAAAAGAPPALGQCEAKLTTSDAAERDYFGSSVSIGDDVAVIGTPYADDKGAAYVFRFDGAKWIEEAKLIGSDADDGDEFSFSVWTDDNVALIGARFADTEGAMKSGAAYVYRYDGRDWIEEAKLIASDAEEEDFFGFSVAISDEVAVIGVRLDDDACPSVPNCNSGSAYVYRFDGKNWIEEAKLTASDAAEDNLFGSSVSISGDTAVIGAPHVDGVGPHSGAVYLFRFDGSEWNQEVKLTASDAVKFARFGASVSLSGVVAVIGSPEINGVGFRSGAAYVFRFDGSKWNEEAKLAASDGASGDYFGTSVSLRSDVALIGAFADDDAGSNSGSAYVFRYNGSDWVEEAKLTALDGEKADRLGTRVSVTDRFAVIGAAQDDDACPRDPDCNSGAAYVFDLPLCLCTGGEKLKKPKCKARKARNKLTTKVVRGMPGNPFTIELRLGENSQGFLNDKGKGKATFVGLPSGPGQATAAWKCGSPPRPRQRRSYECP